MSNRVELPADLVGATWHDYVLTPDPEGMARWLGSSAWKHQTNTNLATGPNGFIVAINVGITGQHLILRLPADQGAHVRPSGLGVPAFDRIEVIAGSLDVFYGAVRQGTSLFFFPSADQLAIARVWLDDVFCSRGPTRIVGKMRPGARLTGFFWHQPPYWHALPGAAERLAHMDARRYTAALQTMLPHRDVAGVALEAGCIARALGRPELALELFAEAGSVVDQVDLLLAKGRVDDARALADGLDHRQRAYRAVLGLPDKAPTPKPPPARKPKKQPAYRRSSSAVTGDLQALHDAVDNASETTLPRAQAELGLALLEAKACTDAWTFLERAAMGLPSSGVLTKKVFAALEDLDARGFSPD